MVWQNCYWTYFAPTTFIVFIRVCSSPKSLDRPKSAIFGTMLSSNNMLAGWRSRWIIGLSVPLCRKYKPWQMPLIILKHVAQGGLEDISEEWEHGSRAHFFRILMTKQLCWTVHPHTKNTLGEVSVGGIFVAEHALNHIHQNVSSIVLYHFLLRFMAVAIQPHYILMLDGHKVPNLILELFVSCHWGIIWELLHSNGLPILQEPLSVWPLRYCNRHAFIELYFKKKNKERDSVWA